MAVKQKHSDLKPHAASEASISRRSRSAAKAIAALRSSFVKSGKSASISSSVISEARYSNTSYTVIRSPRIHDECLFRGHFVLYAQIVSGVSHPLGVDACLSFTIRNITRLRPGAYSAKAIRKFAFLILG